MPPLLPSVRDLIGALIAAETPRAGSFIVTIYGDVVEPRGGLLWIGNIIETCAAAGISETLVRTAVSRLVAADRLAGEREGRRSFYRLTETARREFLAAATVLFDDPRPREWSFAYVAASDADARPRPDGFVPLGAGWCFGPGVAPAASGTVVFRASATADPATLAALAAAHWDLGRHAAAYEAFVAAFAPVAAALDQGLKPTDEEALQLRLLLVHGFRLAALEDPRLPAEALPADWPERRARRLFARLYRGLSEAADRHVAERFVSMDGPLPATTPAVERRLASLARQADSADA